MVELEPLRCKCCGGPYDPKDDRCAYCGTWYRQSPGATVRHGVPHYHIALAAAQCGGAIAVAKAFERLASPRGLL